MAKKPVCSTAVVTALAVAVAAQAQDVSATEGIYSEAAELMLRTMPETGDAHWALSWGSMATRVSAGPAHWRLADPDAHEGGFSGPDAFRRTGWLAASGRQASVAVCGGAELVTGLAFRFNDPEVGETLAAALTAQGATVELTEALAPAMPSELDPELGPDERETSFRYSVAAPDRRPAAFQVDTSCTSPRSRAAQRCWSNVSVTLVPDDPQVPACVNPGRY
jgi:hypothetical protein